MGGFYRWGISQVGGFLEMGEGFHIWGNFHVFGDFYRWGDLSQVGGIPPFSHILPVFANFRKVGDEAHRTTKFLDRRRFRITNYVGVFFGTTLVV